MTPLEQKVVSLDLSKQLYEAGIVVESEYRWVHAKSEWLCLTQSDLYHLFDIGFDDLDMGAMHNGEDFENYPAPLSSELLEELMVGHDKHIVMEKRLSNFSEEFYRSYQDTGHYLHVSDDRTLQDSLAKTMLYLIKEKGLL